MEPHHRRPQPLICLPLLAGDLTDLEGGPAGTHRRGRVRYHRLTGSLAVNLCLPIDIRSRPRYRALT